MILRAGWIFRTKCDFLKPIGGFNFPAETTRLLKPRLSAIFTKIQYYEILDPMRHSARSDTLENSRCTPSPSVHGYC